MGGPLGSEALQEEEEAEPEALSRVLGWRLGLTGGQRAPCCDCVSE